MSKSFIINAIMLLISTVVFILLFRYLKDDIKISEEMSRYLRIITSLAAAAASMSLSGTIKIGDGDTMQTFAEKEPKITAVGALAVFVIVYLFDPISFS